MILIVCFFLSYASENFREVRESSIVYVNCIPSTQLYTIQSLICRPIGEIYCLVLWEKKFSLTISNVSSASLRRSRVPLTLTHQDSPEQSITQTLPTCTHRSTSCTRPLSPAYCTTRSCTSSSIERICRTFPDVALVQPEKRKRMCYVRCTRAHSENTEWPALFRSGSSFLEFWILSYLKGCK